MTEFTVREKSIFLAGLQKSLNTTDREASPLKINSRLAKLKSTDTPWKTLLLW